MEIFFNGYVSSPGVMGVGRRNHLDDSYRTAEFLGRMMTAPVCSSAEVSGDSTEGSGQAASMDCRQCYEVQQGQALDPTHGSRQP